MEIGVAHRLADRIQHTLSESIWEKTVFGTPETRKKLIKNTADYWAELDNEKTRKQLEEELDKHKDNGLKAFEDFVLKALVAADVQPSDKTVELWIKKQAWDNMLDRARVALRNYAEGMRFSTYPRIGWIRDDGDPERARLEERHLRGRHDAQRLGA